MSKIITLKDKDTIIYPRTIYKQVCGDKSDKFGNIQGFIDGLTPVPESPYKYYTVRIDLNNSDPETSCTYMDDAIGMTPGYDGWKDTNLISGIRPCLLRNNGTVYEYLNKDNFASSLPLLQQSLNNDMQVMVEFPLMGYKLWNDDNYQYVSVTDDPNAEDKGYCYYAHSLNTEKDCDKIYIGAFLNSLFTDHNNLFGSYPNVDIEWDTYSATNILIYRTLQDFRSMTLEKGNGYSLISFYPYVLLQCLYVIIYKNLNSSESLGIGKDSNLLRLEQSGYTMSSPFCSYYTENNKNRIKFLGIEDMWGGLGYWVDGVYISSDGTTINTTYKNNLMTSDNGENYDIKTHISFIPEDELFIKKVYGTNTTGFIASDFLDSVSNYYSDYAATYSNSYFGYAGNAASGISGAGVDGGIFSIYGGLYDDNENDDSVLGSRLMYKHLANAGGQ